MTIEEKIEEIAKSSSVHIKTFFSSFLAVQVAQVQVNCYLTCKSQKRFNPKANSYYETIFRVVDCINENIVEALISPNVYIREVARTLKKKKEEDNYEG